MSNVALATAPAWPDLGPGDAIAARALRERGHEVTAAIWSEPRDWQAFDVVIVRSCWDYHLHVEAFLSWADSLPVPIFNVSPLLRWNAHKSYLGELSRLGFPVVPSRFLERGTLDASLFDDLGTDRLVVKPAVSASAYQTRLVTRDALRDEPAEAGAVIVQPFIDAIREGEWSVVMIDGRYAHAVLKRHAAGDFRVQQEHGGKVTLASPPPAVRSLAEQLVAALPHPTLYARVDSVVTANGPLLMELELIEPELYFELAPQSLTIFCEAIERCLA